MPPQERHEEQPARLRGWLKLDLPMILAATVGGIALAPTGLPAAWLIGGVIGVILLMLVGPRDLPSSWTVESAMVLAGIVLGSAATPEAVAATARYPGSIAILIAAMIAVIVLAGLLLVYVGGWSKLDALLGAAPGALSTVIAIALERGAGIERITTIQLFRLYALILLLPPLIVGLNIAPPLPPAMPEPPMSLAHLAILAPSSLALALLFRAVGMTSPMILGAATASAILHATDMVTGTLPRPLVIASFVLMAVAIGGRFARVSLSELVRLLPLALAAFAVSMVVAALFAWPASLLAGVPLLSAMIAFAPGALEAMAILAFALGLDPLYVAAHHLIRFFAIAFSLPFIAAWLMRRRRGDP